MNKETTMKITVDRAALIERMNLLSGIVRGRSFRPQLQCILWTANKKSRTLELAATNGEVSMVVEMGEVDVHEGGQALIGADRTAAILGADGSLTLMVETDGDHASLRGDGTVFKLFGCPPADFPPLPDFAKAVADKGLRMACECDLAGLDQALARVSIAISSEHGKYAVAGVFLKRGSKGLEVVAIDGRRMAAAGMAADGDGGRGVGAVIPPRAATAIRKIAAFTMARASENETSRCKLAITGTQMLLEAEGITLAASLVEYTFPAYEEMVPKERPISVNLDREATLAAMRAVALVGDGGVRATFGDGKLSLVNRAAEVGEANIECATNEHQGDAITIGLNPRFFSDALAVLDTPCAKIELSSPAKPVMLSTELFRYVVTPVDLNALP